MNITTERLEEEQKKTVNSTEIAATGSSKRVDARRAGGFQRLLTISSVVMTAALPIGIVPRILQTQELQKSQAKVVSQQPLVSTIKPSAAPGTHAITLPGSLEADTEAQLYARANGYVKKRYVDIGDKVKAGQLLADIETPELDDTVLESKALVLTNIAGKASTKADLEQAQADLEKAKADLAQARANEAQSKHDRNFAATTRARWNALAAQGAVSKQDADDKTNIFNMNTEVTEAARDRVMAAEAAINGAQAHIDAIKAKLQVDEANIQAAEARKNRSTTERAFQHVFAPFAGVITVRNVDPGALVSAGSDSAKLPMFKLERIDSLRIFVDVPQYAANRIKPGQAVSFHIKEFPNQSFAGKVLRTSFSLDSTTRTLRTEIQVPNKDLTLAPGMYGEVSFAVPRKNQTWVIPASSLVERAEGPQVVTLDGSKIKYISIKLGDDLGKEIEVVAGLSGKEKIVDNPSDTLRDGMSVATR
jgi:RND family efflux transporter MFP subunit